jgi:hypothetical protein
MKRKTTAKAIHRNRIRLSDTFFVSGNFAVDEETLAVTAIATPFFKIRSELLLVY